MAIGFVVTVATIRILPTIAGEFGWRWALTMLAIGPIAGAAAMRSLYARRAPEIQKVYAKRPLHRIVRQGTRLLRFE